MKQLRIFASIVCMFFVCVLGYACSGEHSYRIAIEEDGQAYIEGRSSVEVAAVLRAYMQDLSDLASGSGGSQEIERDISEPMQEAWQRFGLKLDSFEIEDAQPAARAVADAPASAADQSAGSSQGTVLRFAYKATQNLPGFELKTNEDGSGSLVFHYTQAVYEKIQQGMGDDFQAFFDLGPTLPPEPWETYQEFLDFIFQDYLEGASIKPLLKNSQIHIEVETPQDIKSAETFVISSKRKAELNLPLSAFLAPPMEVYAKLSW